MGAADGNAPEVFWWYVVMVLCAKKEVTNNERIFLIQEMQLTVEGGMVTLWFS